MDMSAMLMRWAGRSVPKGRRHAVEFVSKATDEFLLLTEDFDMQRKAFTMNWLRSRDLDPKKGGTVGLC